MAAADFFLGVYMTAVAEGELLVSISVPASANAADGFDAVTIGRDGTCIVSAAACLGDRGARIALGCVDAVPVLVEVEGSEPDGVRAAVGAAGLDPPSDVHGSGDYRRHLAEVCAVRAVQQASERGAK